MFRKLFYPNYNWTKIHGDVISNSDPALGHRSRLKGQEAEVLHSDLVDTGRSEGESGHRNTLETTGNMEEMFRTRTFSASFSVFGTSVVDQRYEKIQRFQETWDFLQHPR